MTKFFLLPLMVLGLIASLTASQHLPVTHGPAEHPRYQPVVLGVGDTLDLPDGTVLEFVELVEDSRCPADAMCVWQGHAVLRFEHRGSGPDAESILVTFTGPDSSGALMGAVGVQVLDVQPYPLASQPHDPADAEVTLRLYSPTS